MRGQQLWLFSEETGHSLNREAPDPQTTIDAKQAFETWIARQQPAFRKSSRQIYQWLWGKFLRYLEEEGIGFLATEPNDITLFLSSLPIKRQQRERYQKIILRAFNDLTEIIPNVPALTPHLIEDPFRRTWRNAPSNTPTQFLTLESQARFEAALARAFQELRSRRTSPSTVVNHKDWKAMRDLAIVTLLYYCGIKPAELSVLSVSCISDVAGTPSLNVGAYEGLPPQEARASGRRDPNQDATHAWQAPGMGANRLVPLPRLAHRILSLWIEVREGDLHGLQGVPRHLFPGTRRPTMARPTSVMNMATLVRVVSDWSRAHAGIDTTAQRLRNTYGARLVEQDKSLDEIERLMGYAPGAASAFRLRSSWIAFRAQHANYEATLASTAGDNPDAL